MTRINVVPPEELHTKHLVAEYRELPRVFGLASKAAKGQREGHREIVFPEEFVLGPGHVTFFYPRLFWLALRHRDLVLEMKARGFKPKLPDMYDSWWGDVALQEAGWWRDWNPTQAALDLNRARLAARAPKPASALQRCQRAPGRSSAAPVQPGPKPSTAAGGQKNGQGGDATFCSPLPPLAFQAHGNGARSICEPASRPSAREDTMKTFDKKSAAIKAAAAHIKMLSVPDSGIGFDVVSSGVEANELTGDQKGFTATIFVDGHTEEQVAKIAEASPDFVIKVQEMPAESAAPTASSATPKPRKEPSAPRATPLTGYTLQPAKFDAEGKPINPRKPGSFGHTSMNVIIANPGIEVGAFVKAGGRMTDLRWDIDHGNVVATPPAAAPAEEVAAPAEEVAA